MGIGSETTANILARFKADVIDLKPKIVIIEAGVNDIATSVTQTTFISNYNKMLDSCAVHGIRAIICHIMPWTNGTNAQMQKRDKWNASLDSLSALHAGTICINFDTPLGQFRVGGDAGNLWDIKTAYDSDGVHFTLAGYTKIAEVIKPRLYQ
jgi:lysophospholipase L1-like esterase